MATRTVMNTAGGAKGKTAVPGASKPKVAKPKVAKPKVAKPKVAKPKVAKPKVKAQTVVKPLRWTNLLSVDRLPGPDRKGSIAKKIVDHRSEHERDFDRVVFCTPVRRLKDKTQVFPLDMHDGVRTRLTHSLEVANLARSMGVAISARVAAFSKINNSSRNIPSLLATIALTHDLGNPPFGHQGEVAIRKWVELNEEQIKEHAKSDFNRDYLKDFLQFEGNAQGFRILTRLQHQDFASGLRLTASTLRAFMKYPWMAERMKLGGPKKFGCFLSERPIFEWASQQTGLAEGVRHPLSYVMEACDDIAYSVLDIEDAVKKEIVSAADVASFMRNDVRFKSDLRVKELMTQYNSDQKWLNSLRIRVNGDKVPLSSKEIRDSQIDIMRSYAIGLMVSDAIERFVELEKSNSFHLLSKGIAEDFKSTKLIDAFKTFGRVRVYSHTDVITAELKGHSVIPRLMTAFWRSVVNHAQGTESKIDEYVMSVISPNYVRVYHQSQGLGLPLWYRQVQLVCDQVCGMTDSFALRTCETLDELGAL